MRIHSTVENIRNRRATYAKRMHDLVDAASSGGVVTTGVRVYEQMAETRWKIDAVDYVLVGFEDGVDAEAFLSVLDGLRRDLIAKGAHPTGGMRAEPDAYWHELGKMERDMQLAEEDARRMLRDKAVAESLRA
ncbi:hypothetical protein MAL1_00238 [Bacteriophage DSS3_MAL1]|nr:hypothetical protein MAL1_00238 [Bacteriophage DSS3_MAL1]